jgi:1-acyl-sn-glycerol-3-phosphate acyltransferase
MAGRNHQIIWPLTDEVLKFMIRLILIAILIIGFLILSIPILLVEWIIGKFNPHARDISSLRIIQFIFRLILLLTGSKVTILGEEHVPKDVPVLYIGNHQSNFDVVLSYSRCPGLTGYVAKDSMKKIPLLSTWMSRLYCLFLDRSNLKEGMKMILKGIEQIKGGVSMCIYPEGTRNKTPENGMLPFKEGSFKMAEKTGCPIIPMAVTNTAEIFEKHFPWIRPAHVILEYGEPIYVKELDKEQKKFLGSYTQKIIEQMLEKHQAMI